MEGKRNQGNSRKVKEIKEKDRKIKENSGREKIKEI